MTKEYRAKAFKSCNSVALRLPKGLGVVDGKPPLIEDLGRFTSVIPMLAFDLAGISDLRLESWTL